jgi:hypothetical protein
MDDLLEGLDVGSITGKNLVSHRYSFPGHKHSYNNLHPVGALVFGIPVFRQTF